MATIWFCIVAVMVAIYVVLDGFDLGAGIAHLLVARTDEERRTVLRSIGPVWDGNEVWLLAGGGVLYFAFPALYAAGFQGFYLPLMMVLWLLILRAVSIEFRNHIDSPAWKPLWDVGFAVSSVLLAVFFGAALGNVVRGVPLSQSGDFFLPLWTDFTPGPNPGILDWYTVLTGVAALVTLTVHGALWLALKTAGTIEDRSRALAGKAWWALAAVVALLTVASFQVQPHIGQAFADRPFQYIFPLLAVAGLLGIKVFNGAGKSLLAFLSSAIFIIGMLTSAVLGLYPLVLPSNTNAALSLSITNAAAPEYGLKVGLAWFIPGILLALGYFYWNYRAFAGKLRPEDEGY